MYSVSVWENLNHIEHRKHRLSQLVPPQAWIAFLCVYFLLCPIVPMWFKSISKQSASHPTLTSERCLAVDLPASLASPKLREGRAGRLGVNRRQVLWDLIQLVSLLRSTPSRLCQTRLRIRFRNAIRPPGGYPEKVIQRIISRNFCMCNCRHSYNFRKNNPGYHIFVCLSKSFDSILMLIS